MSASEFRGSSPVGSPDSGTVRLPAAAKRVRAAAAGLFPEPAAPARRAGLARWAVPLAGVAVVALGALVMLVRLGGRPAWDTVWGEDPGIYLPAALAHPWQLLQSYAGYLQLVPRVLGQVAALLPVQDVAATFAAGGALVTSAVGLFAYHASAGHISSRFLRILLGLSVVLLPVAQLEVADNGANTNWYLLVGLFWAALWRPRSRAGAVAAAVMAFAAAASSSLGLLFAPLFAARLIAVPRRWREHAATTGWALGCLLQAGVILTSHESRIVVHNPLLAVRYYLYHVVLPALGWHLSWSLRDLAGRHGATALLGVLIFGALAWAAVTQPGRCRIFVITAVLTGFAATAVTVVDWGGPIQGVTVETERAARYSTVPILLLDAALIVAADACARRWRPRSAAVAAVAALTLVLVAGWATDFRYPVDRTTPPAADWAFRVSFWLRHCALDPAGSVTVRFQDYWGPAPIANTFSCSSIRR